MVDRGKEPKPFKKKFLSELAGLRFPVARIHRYLRDGPYSPNSCIGAAVYIAAVLEYLCAEIFELSVSVARSFNRMRITPRHTFLAVHDQELSAIFRDVTISEGVVLSRIHTALLKRLAAKLELKPKQ
ncbi:histone H2A-like [Panulirus ornatus]|uniref:histone H2A-like n=1 Tax=Panulirus ornatus TaxID=150431 RepID=UPI003A88BE01